MRCSLSVWLSLLVCMCPGLYVDIVNEETSLFSPQDFYWFLSCTPPHTERGFSLSVCGLIEQPAVWRDMVWGCINMRLYKSISSAFCVCVLVCVTKCLCMRSIEQEQWKAGTIHHHVDGTLLFSYDLWRQKRGNYTEHRMWATIDRTLITKH